MFCLFESRSKNVARSFCIFDERGVMGAVAILCAVFLFVVVVFIIFNIPHHLVGSKKIELPNWVAQLQVRPVTTMRNRYIVLLAVYNCQPSLCFFNVCAFIFFY